MHPQLKRKNQILCALDVGSSKTRLLMARMHCSGRVEILAGGSTDTCGLTKGIVVNLAEVAASIRHVVEEAESKTNIPVNCVVAGISGNHIMSHNFSGAVEIKGKHGEVTAKDMESVIRAASIPLSQEREVLHILPTEFFLNGRGGIRNPVGLTGPQLDLNLHVVSCDSALSQSLVSAANRARTRVRRIILQSIASGEAVLTPEERSLGVAVIDIGAGTTDIAVYMENSICHTSVLPVGGAHFTSDLVEALHTSRQEAERVKIEFGSVIPEQIDSEETTGVQGLGMRGSSDFSRKEICEYLYDRGAELLELVKDDIFGSVEKERLLAGAVLTGGGSQTEGMVDLAGRILEMPVRLGSPMGFEGLGTELKHSTFSCAVGLILLEARKTESQDFFSRPRTPYSWTDRIVSFFEK
ncbi:MAG: cell division protein FtsA [Acidobacteriota bacterium]